MARYSEDYTLADAQADAAADARAEAIKECMDIPEFEWKWRIVKSATRKINTLRWSADPADQKKAKDLARRIKHLEKFCDDCIATEMFESADAAAEARDPYAYRGLSRSMFI